jgi:single-strand DNA-binding protein
MFHQLTIIGNLGREPEMRYTPNGKAVTSFSVATNRNWTGADGQKVKETIWFRISCWDASAEAVSQYLHKGSQVLILGRLQPGKDGSPRLFQRQNGSNAASYEVTADTIRFLNGSNEGHTKETVAIEKEEQIAI